MSQINCAACDELRTNAPVFVENGVTDAICNSMAADTGINSSLSPKHNDATDLHTANDCLVGKMDDDIESYNVCDWQEFMHKFLSNLHELLKLMICALGGIWTKIHDHESRIKDLEDDVSVLKETVADLQSDVDDLENIVNQLVSAIGGSSNTVPVIRKYSYTVPVEKFIDTWESNCTTEGGGSSYVTAWFSGATGIECYISIPVTEMETVVGVWAQPYVVPSGNSFDGKGKDFMETVAVQTWSQQGSNIIVNFDTYELAPPRIVSGDQVTQNGGPYPVQVDFLVVGTKTITTLS